MTGCSSPARTVSSARRSTRALLARGAEVVALLQPGVAPRNLDGLDVEPVVADLRDAPAVVAAAAGCRMIFHVAAIYRFWARDAADFYDVNVGGSLERDQGGPGGRGREGRLHEHRRHDRP